MASIVHIDKLKPKDFIYLMDDIHHWEISEKLDGFSFLFGVDADNKLFTATIDNPKFRKYSFGDFGDSPFECIHRHAHEAIFQHQTLFLEQIPANCTIHCEVLFGKQPNAITYGSNYIVLLFEKSRNKSQINIIPTILDKLQKTGSRSKNLLLHSTSGLVNTYATTEEQWIFTPTPNANIEATKEVICAVDNYREWLSNPSTIPHKNIWCLLNTNLNHYSKAERADIKQARFTAQKTALKFQLDIKNIILQQSIRGKQSALNNNTPDPIGIEGVVIKSESGNKLVKIVDTENFTVINSFNHSVRNQLKRTSYSDPHTHLLNGKYADSSWYDEFHIELAELFNIENIKKYNNITSLIKAYKLESSSATVTNLINTHPTLDKSVQTADVVKLISKHHDRLHAHLTTYNIHYHQYEKTLSSGVIIRYGHEIHQRTLAFFAELNLEITHMLLDARSSVDISQLLLTVYKKPLISIH